ncbi:MAG TPA: glycine--tRNA ligase subunit beta [Acidiferrobacteraceae bacterium]|nr:glycine--tRNA ligase subunit beta [Acidiferrobacteraceae bacterium]
MAIKKKKVAAPSLLVELGTEELPPKALSKLSAALGEHLYKGLQQAALVAPDSEDYAIYATPRRLAVKVPAVLLRQPDREQERRGPAIQAAFDEHGVPTKAALGFAGSCGVAINKLQRLETDKGSWLVYRKRQKGQAAKKLIPDILAGALGKLPIPKRMRWADMDAEFVRPVHWLVLLHGADVIPAALLSVKSGRHTQGHRFHHPKPIALRNATVYPDILETRGHVIADFSKRRNKIEKGVARLAKAKQGQVLVDDALLDEVTGLVEWPQPILGGFDKAFLKVPAEALITTMRDNQKYFAVTKKAGTLLPYFITVANIKSRSPAKIRKGNERVLAARFSDARFFWDTDRKGALADHVEELADVVFHIKLGSMGDKAERLSKLAGTIAADLGVGPTLAERAGLLSKADLLTGMVGEFPSLQGTMGRYYAGHDGEDPQLAAAMEEQYLPRYAGDRLPQGDVGRAVAIADKLDSLVGIFGIGEEPSGVKDPFALRRAALGVLRIMIEQGLELDLNQLLARCVAGYGGLIKSDGVADRVYDYMMERLRAYYQDNGISVDVFESVRVCRPAQPRDFDRRVRAVMAFRKLPEAESLTAANKRIRNILRQAGKVAQAAGDDSALLVEPTEQSLARQVDAMTAELSPLFASGDYRDALKALAGLRDSVDKFFDDIMVMVDDTALRDARLRLLKRLGDLFLRVADLSKLQS